MSAHPPEEQHSLEQRLTPLQRQLDHLQHMVDAAPAPIFLIDRRGTIIAANKATARQLGLPWEELIGSDIYGFVDAKTAASRRSRVEQAIASGQPLHFRDRRQGKTFDHHLCPLPEDVDRERGQVAVFSIDNSDNAATERDLQRSRQLLDATQALTHVGGWVWDIASQTMTWTRETYRIHGLDPDEGAGGEDLIATSLACYDDADRPKILAAFRQCIATGEGYDLTLSFVARDGRRLFVRTIGEAVRQGGQIAQVRGNIMDITSAKRSENLLEARLALAEAAASASLQELLLMTLEEAERLTDSEISFFHFYDEESGMVSLQAWSQGTASHCLMAEPPSAYPLAEAGCWAEAIRGRQAVIHNSYPGEPGKRGLPPGHVSLSRELVVPVLRNERVVAAVGVGNKGGDYQKEDIATVTTLAHLAWDIVLRKRAESELKESEEKYRSLSTLLRSMCDNVPDMIWAKDLDKRYIFANKALCRDLLQAENTDEPIGRTDLFFALRERGRFPDDPSWHTFGELCRDSDQITMDAGENLQFDEFGNVRGHFLLLDVRKAPFIDEHGRAIGTVGSARDVTLHRQAEEALRHSLEEKEVLLREVHHRVKNNLAAILALFDMQRRAVPEGPAGAILEEIGFRVRAMNLVHEKLYRSSSLSRVDFQDYCQSLLAHLHAAFGSPPIDYRIEAREVGIPLDIAVPCGMIINELATNAIKYAFPEERRRPGQPPCIIRIDLAGNGEQLTLTVADNGIGLPPGYQWQQATTLGLMLVRMLGLHQLGGNGEVTGDNGTSFTLTFPLRREDAP